MTGSISRQNILRAPSKSSSVSSTDGRISGHNDHKWKENLDSGSEVSSGQSKRKEQLKLEFGFEPEQFSRKRVKNDKAESAKVIPILNPRITVVKLWKPYWSSYVCEICVESMTANELFSIKGCSHVYCKNCIVKYISSKLEENITYIRCPVSDCRGQSLNPDYCRNILPTDVFDRWGIALIEDLIPGAEKFYCPFKDCSKLLIDDGSEIISESECPYCRRLFCARCKVSWHAGIGCNEFGELNKDERGHEDIMLMKLAEEKNWKRCPNCRYYVEKKDGCNYTKCRYGNAFCYKCGAPSTDHQYHYCVNCGT